MRQINPGIRPRRHGPERIGQFPLMHPDLGVGRVQKLIQPARMVQMQMPDDDLLDVLDAVPGRRHRRPKLMARLVPHAREDVR